MAKCEQGSVYYHPVRETKDTSKASISFCSLPFMRRSGGGAETVSKCFTEMTTVLVNVLI